LCADNYCMRYRPAARRPQMVDTGMSHLGFRCVKPPEPAGGGSAPSTVRT
jgi:formylglycine-generating enzyme